MGLNVGDPIPLYCQLADYNASKHVRAFVEDPSGNPIAGSPFNLAPDATGGYSNVSGVMPNQPWVRATYIVYDDAYVTISTTEGGSGETFFGSFAAGDSLPLFNQLSTYDPTKFVRAIVTNSAGSPISGSPFNLLAEGSTGNYRNVTGKMTPDPWVNAKYLVYSDAGYTSLDGGNGGDNESIYPSTTNSSVIPSGGIAAFVSGDCCDQGGPIEETIIQGSSKILQIRLASTPGGDPFVLTGASNIEFRMRNADGTILSLTLAGTVVIVNPGGGQISVTISAVQTALLAPALPAPATIRVTIGGKLTIINLPTQIAVEEQEV